MTDKHPIQPLYLDEHGTRRFKANAIVTFLLDGGPYDLNKLAVMPFSNDDREQFAQLIGYSLYGFGELSYVSDETYEAAKEMGMAETEARIKTLETRLKDIKDAFKKAVVATFPHIHPDDL